jgi:Zn-dependent peptidase ImmA (M78 family)
MADLRQFVEEELLATLFGDHRSKWSGMTIPCDEHFIVIMNETHTETRQNATLMEEYFHIVLRHKPSKVGLCPITGLIMREFDKSLEAEAYHSAAAALVPYAAMRDMVRNRSNAREIARHFEVSDDLVAFRLKTCKLYRRAS